MPPRRQSAASLPSHAPHGVRRGCWMNRIAGVHGEAMYTAPDCAARAALQAAICQCRGQGAVPLRSLGGSKGGHSLTRENGPPFSAPLHGAGIEARYRAAFYAVQQNCTGSVAALSHSSSSPLRYGEIAAKTLA